jgi:hypothetical protein
MSDDEVEESMDDELMDVVSVKSRQERRREEKKEKDYLIKRAERLRKRRTMVN